MGKLAVYKYLSFMLLVFTLLVAAFIIMGLFGGNANPATGTAMALTVYVLPLLIVVDFILLGLYLLGLLRSRTEFVVSAYRSLLFGFK